MSILLRVIVSFLGWLLKVIAGAVIGLGIGWAIVAIHVPIWLWLIVSFIISGAFL